jgi:hypothetical protein
VKGQATAVLYWLLNRDQKYCQSPEDSAVWTLGTASPPLQEVPYFSKIWVGIGACPEGNVLAGARPPGLRARGWRDGSRGPPSAPELQCTYVEPEPSLRNQTYPDRSEGRTAALGHNLRRLANRKRTDTRPPSLFWIPRKHHSRNVCKRPRPQNLALQA